MFKFPVAIKEDGTLLDKNELEAFEASIESVKAISAQSDAQAIEQACKALSLLTEPFAAKRMNNNIAKVLSGKNISEF